MTDIDYGTTMRSIITNINIYIGQHVEKFGLKQGQYEYFLLICSAPGINQQDLARLKNVSKASVTKALKILENDRFITRITDEYDRRNTLCFLSEKGESIAADLFELKEQAQERLFQGFTLADRELLLQYLVNLQRNSLVLSQQNARRA